MEKIHVFFSGVAEWVTAKLLAPSPVITSTLAKLYPCLCECRVSVARAWNTG